MLQTYLHSNGFSAKNFVKKPEAAIKPDTFREVLRPKSRLRMTVQGLSKSPVKALALRRQRLIHIAHQIPHIRSPIEQGNHLVANRYSVRILSVGSAGDYLVPPVP